MKYLRHVFCLTLSLTLIVLPIGSAQAAMIDNDHLISQAHSEPNQQELLQILDREEVRQQLTALGVSADAVKERVNRMTDDEVVRLNQRLADLPAGEGADVLGILLVIFIVFVVTDVLGATDIFPFIRPIR